jgi:hypothetical protein
MRRPNRRRSSGQGLVEFSLVGGLFFFLLFSVMDAGFYLYGANTVQYAADIGTAAIAAEGNYSNPNAAAPNEADTVSIARMVKAGLNNIPLVKVTEIDIWKETDTNGVFADDTSDALCNNGPCENIYNGAGVLQNPINGAAPWAATVRNIGPEPDYAKMLIHFQYSVLIGTLTIHSTSVNVFRLEPQQ